MSDQTVVSSSPEPVFDLQYFLDRDPWKARAACLGVDPELFFPSGQGPKVMRMVEDARAVCRECPVRVECATYALNRREEYGIWGGLDEGQRKRLLRAPRVSA